MRTASALIAILLLVPQTRVPDTDVFLSTLTMSDGKLSIGKPENISNSPGYDNQPSFSPDGRTVYFTSARGGAPNGMTDAQMDIYRYDIGAKTVTQVTKTDESEYSATVMPDSRYISVIRVEGDKTQRLWKFTTGGADPSLILTDIKPVGYHVWVDDHTVAVFVLGQPATLQVADTRTGRAVIAANDIGRSLQRIPAGGVSFVQRTGDAAALTFTIMELTMRDGTPMTRPLVQAAPGATEEFVAWTRDGTLLMAAAGSLQACRRGDKEWRPVAELSTLGLRNVSRLAISPDATYIALVSSN